MGSLQILQLIWKGRFGEKGKDNRKFILSDVQDIGQERIERKGRISGPFQVKKAIRLKPGRNERK